jgi:hypothetical protein
VLEKPGKTRAEAVEYKEKPAEKGEKVKKSRSVRYGK